MYSRKLRQLLVKKGLNRANVLQFHLVEHHHRKRRRKKTQASRNFQVSMRDLMKKLKKRRVVLKLSEPVAYGEENDGEDEVGSADVPEDKELEGVVEGDKDVAEEGKEDDDNDEEFEPTKAIKPSRMFFYHTEYKKQIKLETRCLIVDVIQTFKTLKPEPSNAEKRWFEEHPQFRHLFHMKLDANAKKKSSNHKVQEMWMLLLRTADVVRRREVWFIVNGVPIRYGLREHTLISCLNCRNYPLGYMQFGDRKFVKRHFQGGRTNKVGGCESKAGGNGTP